jgi:hypothetical protein
MMAPKRFKISVGTLHKKTVSYTVCTILNEAKAIALAAEEHLRRSPSDPLYQIVSVEPVAGDGPQSHDIVDRMEW